MILLQLCSFQLPASRCLVTFPIDRYSLAATALVLVVLPHSIFKPFRAQCKSACILVTSSDDTCRIDSRSFTRTDHGVASYSKLDIRFKHVYKSHSTISSTYSRPRLLAGHHQRSAPHLSQWNSISRCPVNQLTCKVYHLYARVHRPSGDGSVSIWHRHNRNSSCPLLTIVRSRTCTPRRRHMPRTEGINMQCMLTPFSGRIWYRQIYSWRCAFKGSPSLNNLHPESNADCQPWLEIICKTAISSVMGSTTGRMRSPIRCQRRRRPSQATGAAWSGAVGSRVL
ncbi:hypothetical protein BDR05DRAFT_327685 [Suillus weaverae]|nr:hypothetical protein BDR05DRAFT_327685 [Suillus weaverae]